MPGEDPGTRDPDDAEHWVAVYAELLAFDEQLVGNLAGSANGHGADVQLLESRMVDLRSGLAYWRSRKTNLKARDGR